MKSQLKGNPRTAERARADLFARLQARRPEIEQAVLTRVYSLADQSDAVDPEYREGLRAAVSAALDYGFVTIEVGEERAPQVPVVLRAQARIAARSNVSLDTVMRRYFAGYALLGDFVVGEAEEGSPMRGAELKSLLRAQAIVFDRLLVAVSREYAHEAENRLDSVEQRRAEQVQRLLAGEILDTSQLGYDLEGSHLGLLVSGPKAEEAVRDLACGLDRRPLLIGRGEGTVWAWLGGRREVDPVELQRLVSSSWPSDVTLATGEPAHGLAGWRLTHQQAKAAFPIALRSSELLVRYADVALLASMLKDDLLATSLRELYLAPLVAERDGGEIMRQTLRAYFTAERNASSAAAALGVNRRTVASRLRAIEDRLGRPLSGCAAEMEAALRLEDMGSPLLPYAAFTRS